MTKIGTFHLLSLFILYLVFFQQSFYFWILSITSILFLPTFLFLLLKFYQHHFYGEFLRFLSLVILFMQQGISFQQALKRGLTMGNWKQRHLLEAITQNVAFSQQKNQGRSGLFAQFVDEIQSELVGVFKSQHLAIDRLCNFRKNLRERLNFRQRSRQIWGFFIYQVGILSLIYLSLFVYILVEFGFLKFLSSFLLSISLYLVGVFFTWLLMKGKKWSI